MDIPAREQSGMRFNYESTFTYLKFEVIENLWGDFKHAVHTRICKDTSELGKSVGR